MLGAAAAGDAAAKATLAAKANAAITIVTVFLADARTGTTVVLPRRSDLETASRPIRPILRT